LGGAARAAHAQTAPARALNPIRIVVFQLGSEPKDSAHQAQASFFSRALVRALVADTTFKVMSHPRRSQDRTGATGDAQYGIIGTLVDRWDTLRIDLRIADIQHVQVTAVPKLDLLDQSPTALTDAAATLAARIRDTLLAAEKPPQ
jgi:hypothetical protein